MKNTNPVPVTLYFSNCHQEYLVLPDSRQENAQLNADYLKQSLEKDKGYSCSSISAINDDNLKNCDILVLPALQEDLTTEEVGSIAAFVKKGGSLLSISDANTARLPLFNFESLLETFGFSVREYLNAQSSTISMSVPHYVTQSIHKLAVLGFAQFLQKNTKNTYPLLFEQNPQACISIAAHYEKGRIIALADADILSNEKLHELDNLNFIYQSINWLSRKNSVDIISLQLPSKIKFWHTENCILELYNPTTTRVKLECRLESDQDALIHDNQPKNRSLPPQQKTFMRWKITPQIFGAQQMRLSIESEQDFLYFDRFYPDTHCIAAGDIHYTIGETKDEYNRTKLVLETGDEFNVTANFIAEIPNNQNIDYGLQLQLPDNIPRAVVKKTEHLSPNTCQWTLKALEPGSHKLTISVKGTGQSVSTYIKVKDSDTHQRQKLQHLVAALDGEISSRLSQAHGLFAHPEIKDVQVRLLSIKEFIDKTYSSNNTAWFNELVKAAHLEISENTELLSLLFDYITPSFHPLTGPLIPHAPNLAIHLGNLHLRNKKLIEWFFFCAEDAEEFEKTKNSHLYTA